jgi:hypothetical protein
LPAGLRTSFALRLFEHGALVAHAELATPAGTALGVTLAPGDADLAALAADFARTGDASFAAPTPTGGALAIRGAVALSDALFVAALDGTIALDGVARIDVSQDRSRVTSGALYADRVAVRFPDREHAPRFELEGVSTLFSFGTSLVWHRLEARAYGGTIASSGLASSNALQATIALRDVRAEDVPIDDTRKVGEAVFGRLAGELRVDRVEDRFFGRGEMRLLDGAFPALRLARAPLARYGLTPPPELAIAPATATIDLAPSGVRFGSIAAAVRGLAAEGEVRIGAGGALEGDVVVTIGEELLRSSAVLVLPAVLTEHLTLPVAISGTAPAPIIHADLGACLGRFAVENRVTDFVTNVVEVITGRAAQPSAPPAPPSERYPIDGDALAHAIVERSARWDELEAYRTRCRG